MKKAHAGVVYTRNIQGVRVPLQLIEVDPDKVKLDTTNPRVSFSMSQLAKAERNDPAATLLLTSQEDTEGLKRSIILSGGVQEPIYVRHDFTAAEGNRRVVAMRAAKEEHQDDHAPAGRVRAPAPGAVAATVVCVCGRVATGRARAAAGALRASPPVPAPGRH